MILHYLRNISVSGSFALMAASSSLICSSPGIALGGRKVLFTARPPQAALINRCARTKYHRASPFGCQSGKRFEPCLVI